MASEIFDPHLGSHILQVRSLSSRLVDARVAATSRRIFSLVVAD